MVNALQLRISAYSAVDIESLLNVNRDKVVVAILRARDFLRVNLWRCRNETLHCFDIGFPFRYRNVAPDKNKVSVEASLDN